MYLFKEHMTYFLFTISFQHSVFKIRKSAFSRSDKTKKQGDDVSIKVWFTAQLLAKSTLQAWNKRLYTISPLKYKIKS